MPDSARLPMANTLSWLLISGMAVACLVVGVAMDFTILLARALLPLMGLVVLAAALMVGRACNNARLVAGAKAFLQMTLFTILGVVLAYLLAARAAPLWDAELLAADARFGIDWPSAFAAADRLPAPLLWLSGVAYHSLTLQMVAAILALAGTGHFARLRTMVAVAIGTGLITILVSGVLPAMGNLFDPDRYEALWPSVAWRDRDLLLGLRSGANRVVDLSHLTGIVSFPSYHAALPAILAWGVYPLRRLRTPAAVWAGLTIVATPLFGGHYLVDVLAGLMLATSALALATQRASVTSSRGLSPVGAYGTRLPSFADLQRIGREGRADVHELT